jgi:hypothetical protein
VVDDAEEEEFDLGALLLEGTTATMEPYVGESGSMSRTRVEAQSERYERGIMTKEKKRITNKRRSLPTVECTTFQPYRGVFSSVDIRVSGLPYLRSKNKYT